MGGQVGAGGEEVGAWGRLCEPAPQRGLPETVILFDLFYSTRDFRILSVSKLNVQS